ncbi:nucleoside diphosphate kinase regulator [Sphingopyxis soli]|jgi:regulator of nucleoside diphosphate kinase|uniref:Nucleoside diphosphate kinase regulator n=1 Tax=Sphingopyxis soli TaxID=592051 RepID=A0ABN1LZN2_9SPHN|nr:nucleoside diphosphate kinase regulator [Sphingopyxis soli]
MTNAKAVRKPPVHMIDREADALTDLAIGVEKRMPQVSELLLREIGRATIHKERHVPRDVVTMNSEVDFVDAASGAVRSVRLVYPSDADISTGRISILTPVGAGLIGLRTGSAILWPDRDGQERALTIRAVLQPPRAA